MLDDYPTITLRLAFNIEGLLNNSMNFAVFGMPHNNSQSVRPRFVVLNE